MVTAGWSVGTETGRAESSAEVSRGGPAPAPPWSEFVGGESARRDWRDTVRGAADLALLGILTTVASLGVVTAGAAVATASAALHHWIDQDGWPGVRPVLRTFVRALLPGAAATAVAVATAGLLTLNLLALARGAVPGGVPLIAVTAALILAAAAFAGLTVVEMGRNGGQGWRNAARAAVATAEARPLAPPATAGVIALSAVLGVLVLPPLAPILAGYTLLALHAVTRRTVR
ncbi:hypothetical protein [Micromonospora sp. NPDC049679]|uniref:hypothetical protein n=1 Tax=Micromonospora sp. NPDC049679 TaxID=3155920 RepID=UPI0033C3FC68